jgi:hypothetical protein
MQSCNICLVCEVGHVDYTVSANCTAGPPYRFVAGPEGGDTPSASGSSFSDDPKRVVAAQESLHTAAVADTATAGNDSERPADGSLAQGSPRSGSGRSGMPATLEQALRGAATEGERQEWRQHFAGRQQEAAAADDLRTSHLLDSAATTPQPGQSNAKSAAPARSASHRNTCVADLRSTQLYHVLAAGDPLLAKQDLKPLTCG